MKKEAPCCSVLWERVASCKLSSAKDKLTEREREREKGLRYAEDDAKVGINSPLRVCVCVCNY